MVLAHQCLALQFFKIVLKTLFLGVSTHFCSKTWRNGKFLNPDPCSASWGLTSRDDIIVTLCCRIKKKMFTLISCHWLICSFVYAWFSIGPATSGTWSVLFVIIILLLYYLSLLLFIYLSTWLCYCNSIFHL